MDLEHKQTLIDLGFSHLANKLEYTKTDAYPELRNALLRQLAYIREQAALHPNDLPQDCTDVENQAYPNVRIQIGNILSPAGGTVDSLCFMISFASTEERNRFYSCPMASAFQLAYEEPDAPFIDYAFCGSDVDYVVALFVRVLDEFYHIPATTPFSFHNWSDNKNSTKSNFISRIFEKMRSLKKRK